MEYTISTNNARVTVSSRGGELKSFVNRDNNREYMWQGHAPYWNGTSPNLFPIVGRVKEGTYTYHGQKYAIKSPHGFVRITELTLREHTENTLVFGLHDNEETRKAYPFAFDYSVRFVLEGKKLTVTQTVINPAENEPLIFALGAHPGFNVPMNENVPFENYYLEFENACKPEEIVCEAAYLTGKTVPCNRFKNGKVLPLRHDLFDNDAIILKDTCRTLLIKCDEEPEQVRVCFDDFRYVGIWHTNETTAPFVCIEPWNGVPSLADAEENLETKYEMMRLKPHEEYHASYSIEIQ